MKTATSRFFIPVFIVILFSGCGGGSPSGPLPPSGGGNSPTPTASVTPVSTCTTLVNTVGAQAGIACPQPTSTPMGAATPTAPPNPGSGTMSTNLHVPAGFIGDVIANFGARELAFLPNGDLLAGTAGQSIVIIPNAEGAVPGKSQNFITLNDQNADGVAYGPDGNIYVATMHYLWKIPYTPGAQSVPNTSAQIIARYRQGGIPAGSDGDQHNKSSVAINGTTIYVGVGSSCNSCTEIDPTRATIQSVSLGAPGPMTLVAKRIRNPMAMTVNPASGVLWAGGAGQDSLTYGHPYEFLDPVTLHTAPADYGWPVCEENNNPFNSGANCTGIVAPIVETYAYSTNIGAVFYPLNQGGSYAFPQQYRGGLFLASHGSWHCCPSSIPKVQFFAMNGDTPATPVTWSDPTKQWTPFLYDMRTSTSNATYYERFTGIAVGPQGSLFVGDDKGPGIYRIRP